MRRRRKISGSVLVAVVALGACGSSGKAKSEPTTTVASTVAPTTEPIAARIYRPTIDYTNFAYQAKDLTPVTGAGSDSGPPVYTAFNLGPGCGTCKITDRSPAATFTPEGYTGAIDWLLENGDVLKGEIVGKRIYTSTDALFAIGHVNKFRGTITITSGTGAFESAHGTLTQDDTTTVLSVDAQGTARKKNETKIRGTIGYPAA